MITRIKIDGYKGARELPLSPLTLVTGPNGSGKSTTLEAVAMLTGDPSRPVASGHVAKAAGPRGIHIDAHLADGRRVEMAARRTASKLGTAKWSVNGQPATAGAVWGIPLTTTGPALRDETPAQTLAVLGLVCARVPGAASVVHDARAALDGLGLSLVAPSGVAWTDIATLRAAALSAESQARATLRACESAIRSARAESSGNGLSVSEALQEHERASMALAALEVTRRSSSPSARTESLRRAAESLRVVPCARSTSWTAREALAAGDWPEPGTMAVDLCAGCPMTADARGAADRLAAIEEEAAPEVDDTREREAVAAARARLGEATRREAAQERLGKLLADEMRARDAIEAATAASATVEAANEALIALGTAAIEEAARDALPAGWSPRIVDGRVGLDVGDVTCVGYGISGAQRVALGVALHVALVRLLEPGDGARVLTVELDELDDERCVEAMGRLAALVETGVLRQVIAARHRAVDAPGWTTVRLPPRKDAR